MGIPGYRRSNRRGEYIMIQDTGDQKGEVSIPGYRRSNRRGEYMIADPSFICSIIFVELSL